MPKPLAVLLAALSVLLLQPAPAGASLEHCVVTVTGVAPSGELEVGEPTCHATPEAALAAAAASDVIGIHYDGFNFTGSSFTVVGDSCIGGYLNLSSTWNNRVSSTWNGCPRVRHWDGYDLTGIAQTTLAPGGNLSTLNNKASSIQYLT